MEIAGIQKVSTIDYPGKISCVVFMQGCNFKCGYCHNPELNDFKKGDFSEEEFFNYIDSRKKLIDGVVICGGEPTLQDSLPYFAREIKKRSLTVKLDTNGSNYAMLDELNKEGLVDYVAMDVKGPVYLYPKIIGRDFIDLQDEYEKSIAIVPTFPDYEFRTTIAPLYENGKIRWITPYEIGDTAKLIYDCTGIRRHKYYPVSYTHLTLPTN